MLDIIAGVILAGTIVYLYILVLQLQQGFTTFIDTYIKNVEELQVKLHDIERRIEELEAKKSKSRVKRKVDSSPVDDAATSNDSGKSGKAASVPRGKRNKN